MMSNKWAFIEVDNDSGDPPVEQKPYLATKSRICRMSATSQSLAGQDQAHDRMES